MKKKATKKRKPNNLVRRELTFTRALLRSENVLLVRIRDYVAVYNSRSLREIAVGSLLQKGINDVPHHWQVTLVVICRTETGNRYFKANEVVVRDQHRANDLTAVLHDQMLALKEECNPKHIIRDAWLATPYPRTWTGEEIDRFLEHESAWTDE